ncbi:MAG: cytochrome c oxidase subunit II [Gemmataceae bacterium]|nr:cytochrome c oxidase subunit II [Gemmataceae bacterium]
MRVFWFLLFALVNLACLGLFVVSPWLGWWLPKNIASFGQDVDNLFYLILAATGFFFVVTQSVLALAILRYGERPGEKSRYTHGHTGLEITWTLIPLAILIYLGFAQVPTWAKMKYINVESWFPIRYSGKNLQQDQSICLVARQWEWRLRYPQGHIPADQNQWAENGDPGDLHAVNELHVWKNSQVRLHLKTEDVIHSLFLPNLRLKQDALPGKTMPVVFQAIEANVKWDPVAGHLVPLGPGLEWEMACAELCGGQHYRMRGRLFVHESKQDYEKWFAQALKNQRLRELPKQVAAREGGNR